MHNLSNRLAGLMVFGALTAALILAVAHGAEKGGCLLYTSPSPRD